MEEKSAKLLEEIKNSGTGLSSVVISSILPEITPEELAYLANDLLQKHLITIEQIQNTNTLIYKALDKEEGEVLSTLHPEERLVYTHIKASSNVGIWVKDLINSTNFHRSVITKIVKSLESRRIIKSVKSVKNPAKKIYMLFDLTPSVEITGGAWFTDQELDMEFISQISKICLKYIERKSKPSNSKAILPLSSLEYPSAEEIRLFVAESGLLSDIELTVSDYTELLQMLVYDGKIEKLLSGKGKVVYRYLYFQTNIQSWTEIPCSKCPVFDMCGTVGLVTPSKCKYFKEWLET
jgi:DNA-directed RNA polymerase III subunit RPC6